MTECSLWDARTTVGIASRATQLETPCAEDGTHPKLQLFLEAVTTNGGRERFEKLSKGATRFH